MSTPPVASPERPVVSERYHVLRKLGSGSLGSVYLARDESMKRLVALKLIKRDRLGPDGLERLQREFRAIASLRHPQIAEAYDFGYTTEQRIPYYTREYVKGKPLSPGPPRSDQQGTPREFLRPFLDLLDALQYIHLHGILHLDIHAGNLIVAKDTKRGSVLIDFGLMEVLFRPRSSSVLELSSSMPPELFGDERLGPSADVYSVGRLLLYRLTGSSEGEPKLPREIPGWGARLTLELERIAAKALRTDSRQRFRSALDFRAALVSLFGTPGDAPTFHEPREVMVGRESVLQVAEGALRRAGQGESSLLWTTGPRGVGKTRFLTEVRLRAQLRGMEVVAIDFRGEATPESALVRALYRTQGACRRGASWLAPLRAEHGGSSLDRARRASTAYFDHEGPPLVILLDDFDCADRESALLAVALLEECAARMAAGARDRGLALFVASETKPDPGVRLPGRRRIVRRLGPLSRQDARSLFTALLHPLRPPAVALNRVVSAAEGQPLRLRQVARTFHAEWGNTGAIPPDVEVPSHFRQGSASVARGEIGEDPNHRLVLAALAVLGRPAGREEVAAAADLSTRRVGDVLRHFEKNEILGASRRGRARLYHFSDPSVANAVVDELSRRQIRAVHDRAVAYLERQSPRLGRDACLARHLFALGRSRAGRALAMRTARALRESALFGSALRLLGESLARERSPTWKVRISEEISSIHEQTGDHEAGIAVLEPVYHEQHGPLRGSTAVRIRRRLGAHHHRAGSADRALKLFEEARRLADARRDVEELVLVESELAELHTLRGQYGRAEEACRKGIALVQRCRTAGAEFVGRTELTLRASLGHLELRRMDLERAQVSLEAAAAVSDRYGTTSVRALVLNNLGVVHNQQNRFDQARNCFFRAERLLRRSGERRGIVQIACNLASIAAKTGDAEGARGRVDEARRLLGRYPGKRLEFLVGLTEGLVAHLLGDLRPAMDAFAGVIPVGRELGDQQFVLYAQIYVAEAQIGCGEYAAAARALRALDERLASQELPVFLRMVRARLCALEALVGHPRRAATLRAAFEEIPRTSASLLEAWNDLFIALGLTLRGTDAEAHLESAQAVFDEAGVPAGARFVAVTRLCSAIRRGSAEGIRRARTALDSADPTSHKLLTVLEPLARAEASRVLGELQQAREHMRSAESAIVGQPFLELDWRIELVRASLAERQGDREEARRCLHRSLHTRDLIAGALPAKDREAFLAETLSSSLAGLRSRLERTRLSLTDTKQHAATGCYRGIIGRSPAMVEMFRAIEGIRDLDIPVIITGETGTGKELVARAIHESSARAAGPFLVLHCPSLPVELVESELCGYEAGAFTGAETSRRGLLEHVSGGTLLLDDVTGLTPETQVRLLRAVDSGQVRPLGAVETRPIDVRFLVSAGIPLDAAVAAGSLRADFYFRLRGMEIHVPPLRSRKEDIALLVAHFLEHSARRLERSPARITSSALELLSQHAWPGNVRELENAIIRLIVTCSPGSTCGDDTVRRVLPPPAAHTLFARDLFAGRDLDTLKRDLERAYLENLYEESGGNLQKMRDVLGIKRSTLYRRLQQAGIDVTHLRRRV